MAYVKTYNALVINSNLATPLYKRVASAQEVLERFPESRRSFKRPHYLPEPAQEDPKKHLVVPDYHLEKPDYPVYGFVVPNPVRLRILANKYSVEAVRNRQTDGLSLRQIMTAQRLSHFGHGITLELYEPDVELSPVYNTHSQGFQWSLEGEAFQQGAAASLDISAYGIRGHALTPYFDEPGKALLQYLDLDSFIPETGRS